VFRVLLAVRRLPVLEITISARQAGLWLSPNFPFHGYWAQAVLDLSVDAERYLVGRRKQALRTNLRRAGDLGVQVSRLATHEEWFTAVREVYRSRPDGQERIAEIQPLPAGQEVGYYAATDREGRVVAFAIAVIFNDCAVLAGMVSVPSHPASSSARYLLHTFVCSDLRSRGIRNLIVGTATRVPPGLQYFQYLLGYEVRNLRITVSDAQRTRPAASPTSFCRSSGGRYTGPARR
jgi:hypothetical protein